MVFRKLAWFLCGLLAILLFGDTLLHWTGSVLHVLLEVLELALEHFLESAFGVSGHTAQMLTAWIGFLVFLVLAIILFRQARKSVRKHAAAWERLLGEAGAVYRKIRRSWPGIVVCGLSAAALYFLLA